MSGRIAQLFKQHDINDDGTIKVEELEGVLAAIGFTAEQSQEMLLQVKSSNGDIRYDDFLAWLFPKGELHEGAAGIEAKAERGTISNQHGLWEDAVSNSRTKFIDKYPQERVNQYFDEVQLRLGGREYEEHVKSTFFNHVDTSKDGKVDFQEAYSLILKSLQCAAAITGSAKPTAEEIKAAFDTHDKLSSGSGRLGLGEFTNLCRYLQVRVAEAMLPLSSLVRADATA